MPLAEGTAKCHCLPAHRGYPYRCPQHLNPIDRWIRSAFPSGMRDGVDVTIRFEIGFEDWGSYEDWGQGYIVERFESDGTRVYAADKYLDTAVKKFIENPFRVKPKKNHMQQSTNGCVLCEKPWNQHTEQEKAQ